MHFFRANRIPCCTGVNRPGVCAHRYSGGESAAPAEVEADPPAAERVWVAEAEPGLEEARWAQRVWDARRSLLPGPQLGCQAAPVDVVNAQGATGKEPLLRPSSVCGFTTMRSPGLMPARTSTSWLVWRPIVTFRSWGPSAVST